MLQLMTVSVRSATVHRWFASLKTRRQKRHGIASCRVAICAAWCDAPRERRVKRTRLTSRTETLTRCHVDGLKRLGFPRAATRPTRGSPGRAPPRRQPRCLRAVRARVAHMRGTHGSTWVSDAEVVTARQAVQHGRRTQSASDYPNEPAAYPVILTAQPSVWLGLPAHR